MRHQAGVQGTQGIINVSPNCNCNLREARGSRVMSWVGLKLLSWPEFSNMSITNVIKLISMSAAVGMASPVAEWCDCLC